MPGGAGLGAGAELGMVGKNELVTPLKPVFAAVQPKTRRNRRMAERLFMGHGVRIGRKGQHN